MSKLLQSYHKLPFLLDYQDIHIWIINSSNHMLNINSYFCILSPEEQKKALDYKFTIHKNGYIIRTALLRIIISKYCKVKTTDLNIEKASFGKPYLSNHDINLYFNLSYSENFIYIAFTKAGEIGIDLEYIQEDKDLDSLAGYVLHKNEYKVFKSTACSKQAHFFYRIWSLKEAIVKSVGIGLNYPLSKIQISEYFRSSEFKTLSFGLLKRELSLKLKILKTPPLFVGSLASEVDFKKVKYIHI